MALLSIIRRRYHRNEISIREIARRMGFLVMPFVNIWRVALWNHGIQSEKAAVNCTSMPVLLSRSIIAVQNGLVFLVMKK